MVTSGPRPSLAMGPRVPDSVASQELQARRVVRALVALAAAQIVFGIWPVIGKLVLPYLPARALVGTRIGLSGPLLFLATRPWRAGMSRREVFSCAWLALLGVVANQALFIEGLSRSTPINAAVLGCLIPCYTLLIAVLMRQEAFNARRMLGVVLALLGALWLVGAERLDFGVDRLWGNLALCANTLLYSFYLVLSRPLVAKHGPLAVTGWTFGWSALEVLPYSVPAMLVIDWSALPGGVWAGVAYIVLGASVAAYLLNAYALRIVSASTVAVFVYLQPLVTGVAAGRVLGVRPGWQVLTAAALIFSGVAVTAWRRR